MTVEHEPQHDLVIGATGSNGRLVVERLLEHGDTARALTRTPDKRRGSSVLTSMSSSLATSATQQPCGPPVGQTHDGLDGLIAAFLHDVGGAELFGDCLAFGALTCTAASPSLRCRLVEWALASSTDKRSPHHSPNHWFERTRRRRPRRLFVWWVESRREFEPTSFLKAPCGSCRTRQRGYLWSHGSRTSTATNARSAAEKSATTMTGGTSR